MVTLSSLSRAVEHSQVQDRVGAVMVPVLQLYVVVRPLAEGTYPVAHATLQEPPEARYTPAAQALELPATICVPKPTVGTVQEFSVSRVHSWLRACTCECTRHVNSLQLQALLRDAFT